MPTVATLILIAAWSWFYIKSPAFQERRRRGQHWRVSQRWTVEGKPMFVPLTFEQNKHSKFVICSYFGGQNSYSVHFCYTCSILLRGADLASNVQSLYIFPVSRAVGFSFRSTGLTSGFHEYPPWYSVVCATMTVHLLLCIQYFNQIMRLELGALIQKYIGAEIVIWP